MARGYFFTHKNIHLFTQIESIHFLNDKSAFVTVHVAMAGAVITDINALSRLSARIYKFELQLIKGYCSRQNGSLPVFRIFYKRPESIRAVLVYKPENLNHWAYPLLL